ncbi:hypothetical protein Tco_0668743, partial [Tanacetum coccineum]
SRHFKSFYDDYDYKESTIPLNEIVSQIPPSNTITPVLPTVEPEDSLIMGDEHLSTIPEKESDEVIKSSVEDLIPILYESEDTFDNDSECELPFCDGFPLDVPKEKSMTFSNPLFNSNDDFTSSDDESLSDEDDIEDKVSYVSNLDEPALLVTPLSDVNEDECFNPGGDIVEIEACLTSDSIPLGIDKGDFDPEGDIHFLEKLLNDDPSSPLPLKELHFEELKSLLTNDTIPNLPSDVFLDHDQRSLKDDPDFDDLTSRVKVFDPIIHEKKFSLTYVKLPFEDSHYDSFTYVIRIFLPYFTYPVDSSLPLSSGSEDIIFDPGISALSSLEPMASHRSGISCASMFFKTY